MPHQIGVSELGELIRSGLGRSGSLFIGENNDGTIRSGLTCCADRLMASCPAPVCSGSVRGGLHRSGLVSDG